NPIRASFHRLFSPGRAEKSGALSEKTSVRLAFGFFRNCCTHKYLQAVPKSLHHPLGGQKNILSWLPVGQWFAKPLFRRLGFPVIFKLCNDFPFSKPDAQPCDFPFC